MIAEPQQLADQVSEAIKASATMHHVTKREVWHPNRKDKQQMKAREWAIRHLLWQGLPKGVIARAFEVSDEVVRKIARNAGGMARELAAQDSESITDLNG